MDTVNNHKYSVDPKYVGKSVIISITDDTLDVYYNKEIIKSHKITSKKFTYAEEDYIAILKQNTMKHSAEEDIKRVARNNTSLYDKL